MTTITDPARPLRARVASWLRAAIGLHALHNDIRRASKLHAARSDAAIAWLEPDIAMLDGQLRELPAREALFV